MKFVKVTYVLSRDPQGWTPPLTQTYYLNPAQIRALVPSIRVDGWRQTPFTSIVFQDGKVIEAEEDVSQILGQLERAAEEAVSDE